VPGGRTMKNLIIFILSILVLSFSHSAFAQFPDAECEVGTEKELAKKFSISNDFILDKSAPHVGSVFSFKDGSSFAYEAHYVQDKSTKSPYLYLGIKETNLDGKPLGFLSTKIIDNQIDITLLVPSSVGYMHLTCQTAGK
jgi:hypothetical protein